MRKTTLFDQISRRVPVIVTVNLCGALVACWSDAPFWFSYGLAIIVASLALVLIAGRKRQIHPQNELASTSSGNWIAHELGGNGTPSGFYLLAFFSLLTMVLTGFEGAYALPAWAALALVGAWGIANAHFPIATEDEP